MQQQNYGSALAALKQGKRVARQGWNGKGMFVFMRPADTLYPEFIASVKSLPETVKAFFASQAPGCPPVKFGAYLCLYAADGSIVNGWLASQTDMLAEDWCLLD